MSFVLSFDCTKSTNDEKSGFREIKDTLLCFSCLLVAFKLSF